MDNPLRRAVAPFEAALRHVINLRYLAEAQPITLLTEAEKRQHILAWAEASGHRVFIETGTYLGQTTLMMAKHFERCITIEYDKPLHDRAAQSFAGVANITALHGDAAALIGDVLTALDEPAIFWLDAHLTSIPTARAGSDTSISAELGAIFAHKIKTHIILIDDARLFRGVHNYPRIKDLRRLVVTTTPYAIRIRDDIIRIYREDI